MGTNYISFCLNLARKRTKNNSNKNKNVVNGQNSYYGKWLLHRNVLMF